MELKKLKSSYNFLNTSKTLYAIVLSISIFTIIPLCSIIINSMTTDYTYAISEFKWFFEFLKNSLIILFGL